MQSVGMGAWWCVAGPKQCGRGRVRSLKVDGFARVRSVPGREVNAVRWFAGARSWMAGSTLLFLLLVVGWLRVEAV